MTQQSYHDWIRDQIAKEVLKEEREKRGNPNWVPKLLNGGFCFSRKVEKRFIKDYVNEDGTMRFEREEIKAGLQSAIATVVFEKADGTLRTMRCTLMAEHLPVLEEGHKPRKENDEVLAVYDLENGGWRSFRIDSIVSISFGA